MDRLFNIFVGKRDRGTFPILKNFFAKEPITVPALVLLGLALVVPHGLSAHPKLDGSAPAANPGEYASYTPTGDIRRFAGESLTVDISFLWFDNAAVASVKFYEENGKYYSLLEAETKGFVGFFTSYRKHRYKSTFDITDDGKRVVTRFFEREVIIGDETEKTTHFLDYNSRSDWWFKYKNGKPVDQGTNEIPEGVYFDDILAVFYNFRNGVYGEVKKGSTFVINTIPDKGVAEITVHVINDKEKEKFRSENGREKKDEILLKAVIPKEIFKSKTGILWFWSSRHLVPLETTVKDYILLGDLHAKLASRTYSPKK